LPWLPKSLADRQLESAKLRPVLERGVRALRKVDKFFKPRLSALTATGLMNRLNGLAIIAAGVLLMAPLGFIPFSNTLPGVAVLLLSMGVSQRDGLIVLGGYVMIGLTVLYFGGLAFTAYRAGQNLDLFES
jgi:hypothetical protein